MPGSVAEFMSKMPSAFMPEKAPGLNAVVHFKFTGTEAGEWNAVIREGVCEVAQGIPHFKPTITLTMDSADYTDLMGGELDAEQAFMEGKIRLAGDSDVALRLIKAFKSR